MVEPEGGKVEHLACSHGAGEGLCQPVGRVTLQIWVQRVQRDPWYLGGGYKDWDKLCQDS